MTPRKLAKRFLAYVKYADNLDDFFMLEKYEPPYKNLSRKILAKAVVAIRRSKVEAGVQIAREYWYDNYYNWTGCSDGPRDEARYTRDFEKVITNIERLFSWQ